MASAVPVFRKVLLSRAGLLVAPVRSAVATKSLSTTKVALDGLGGHTYRTAPPPPSGYFAYLPDAILLTMWWWILWGCFSDPGHVFGKYHDIVPSEFTDEELGIPPDDEN